MNTEKETWTKQLKQTATVNPDLTHEHFRVGNECTFHERKGLRMNVHQV